MKNQTMTDVVHYLRVDGGHALAELREMEHAIYELQRALRGLVALASSQDKQRREGRWRDEHHAASVTEHLEQLSYALDEFCSGIRGWKITAGTTAHGTTP